MSFIIRQHCDTCGDDEDREIKTLFDLMVMVKALAGRATNAMQAGVPLENPCLSQCPKCVEQKIPLAECATIVDEHTATRVRADMKKKH